MALPNRKQQQLAPAAPVQLVELRSVAGCVKRSGMRWIRRALGVLALILAFAYGMGVGHYRWPPFEVMGQFRRALLREPLPRYAGDNELLRLAFTDVLVPGEQLLPPITSFDGVQEANHRLLFPVERFRSAYEEMTVVSAERRQLNGGRDVVLRVRYRVAGGEHEAYAYAPRTALRKPRAALSIPQIPRRPRSELEVEKPRCPREHRPQGDRQTTRPVRRAHIDAFSSPRVRKGLGRVRGKFRCRCRPNVHFCT